MFSLLAVLLGLYASAWMPTCLCCPVYICAHPSPLCSDLLHLQVCPAQQPASLTLTAHPTSSAAATSQFQCAAAWEASMAAMSSAHARLSQHLHLPHHHLKSFTPAKPAGAASMPCRASLRPCAQARMRQHSLRLLPAGAPAHSCPVEYLGLQSYWRRYRIQLGWQFGKEGGGLVCAPWQLHGAAAEQQPQQLQCQPAWAANGYCKPLLSRGSQHWVFPVQSASGELFCNPSCLSCSAATHLLKAALEKLAKQYCSAAGHYTAVKFHQQSFIIMYPCPEPCYAAV